MAGSGVQVTGDLDPLRELRAQLAELAELSASAGYHEAKLVPDSDTLTVPELAAIQTFGNENTPKRPFMQRAAAAFETSMQPLTEAELANPPVAVQKLAADLAQTILTELETAGAWAEPNDKATIREKGSSVPLYAKHGTLRNELSYVVLRNNTVIAEGKPSGQ